MFKDYEKYLSTSLIVYLFVLVIIFIMKMVGLDYFGIEINNSIVNKINIFMNKYNLVEIWYSITLFIYAYIMISIISHEKSKRILIISIITTTVNIACILTIKYYMNQFLISLFDFLLLYLACLIANKFKLKYTTKRMITCFIISVVFQIISLITRNNGMVVAQDDFISYFILNLDYILLMLIYHKIYFLKGDVKLCGMVEVGSFSLKKLNLKNLLTKLQKNWRNFKKQDKVTKLTYIIYFILSLIWNTLSIVLILFVAMLNDTFIECIFILTSFWLSKKSFGKAFHFSSMAKCFIVSNLSYYILNRITTPLGISIIVPILLGVGLSYVTSKFVKKPYKPLYRGMPEELFEETILKIVDKDSVKYNICYDFYIKNKSIVALSIKYNYTESGIRKIKDRVNEKIKRL